jgi:hypothetical protein
MSTVGYSSLLAHNCVLRTTARSPAPEAVAIDLTHNARCDICRDRSSVTA